MWILTKWPNMFYTRINGNKKTNGFEKQERNTCKHQETKQLLQNKRKSESEVLYWSHVWEICFCKQKAKALRLLWKRFAYIWWNLFDVSAAKHHVFQRWNDRVFALCWSVSVQPRSFHRSRKTGEKKTDWNQAKLNTKRVIYYTFWHLMHFPTF